MAKKKHLESPLQRERKEFERLLISLEKTWSEEVGKEIITLVGGLQNKDHDVQVKQAKRLLFVLSKYDRREQMIIIARLLSFSARRRLHKQLIKEGKIQEAERTAQHFDLTVLPDELEAVLWPKKMVDQKKNASELPSRPSAPVVTVRVSDQEPLTPFGKDIAKLKTLLQKKATQIRVLCVRIWNTLIS